MSVFEIMLLVVGSLLFIGSFFIPEKEKTLQNEDRLLGEAAMKELVTKQMDDVKSEIEVAVEETIQYSIGKTERALDRITNEKIMAINEYSDTVLDAIHTNHDEVIFLYDMLNKKHEDVLVTAKEVDISRKIVKDEVGKQATKLIMTKELEAAELNTVGQVSKIGMRPKVDQLKDTDNSENLVEKAFEHQEKEPMEDILASFDANENLTKNSNELILKLHQEGKSNMEIAKELGLGVGEVKLVIDLFK